MKRFSTTGFLIFIFLIAHFLVCSQPLKGKWLGQTPPGLTPVVFAKGVVSSDSLEHSAAIFSPDGRRLLWTVIHRGKPAYLLEMRLIDGQWTDPAKPSFASNDADDFYP